MGIVDNIKKYLFLLLPIIIIFNFVACSKNKEVIRTGIFVEEDLALPADIIEVYEIKNIGTEGNRTLLLAGYNAEEEFKLYKGDYDNWQQQAVSIPEGIIIADCLISNEGICYIECTNSDYNSYSFGVIDGSGNYEKIEKIEAEQYGFDFKFKDNKLAYLNSDNNMKIYDVDKKEIVSSYDINDNVYDFIVNDDKLIVMTDNSVIQYDLAAGKEEKHLAKIEEKLFGSDEGEGQYGWAASVDKDKLYFYKCSGLYCYDLKSEEITKLVNGEGTKIADFDSWLNFINQLNEDEFIAAYSQKDSEKVILAKYYYTEDLTKIKKENLTIYSLYQDQIINDVIQKYKNQNNLNITYTYGISNNDAITEDDAIKILNTEIMAGNGPDIIVMDGMNIASYIDKGILEDISGAINNKDELFENVINNFLYDEKLYAVPLTVKLPVVIGQDTELSAINSFNDLKVLSENSSELIISDYSKNALLSKLLIYYFTDEQWIIDGKINEQYLTQFLEAYKIIFDDNDKLNYLVEEPWKTVISVSPVSLLDKNNGLLDIGFIDSLDTLASILSFKNGDEIITYKSIGNGIEPKEIIAVNSKSNKKNLAYKFISDVLKQNYQSEIIKDFSLPINKLLYINDDYDLGVGNESGIRTAEGKDLSYKIRKITEAELVTFIDKIEEHDNIMYFDNKVRTIYQDALDSYINNTKDLAGTKNEIINKMNIYLSE